MMHYKPSPTRDKLNWKTKRNALLIALLCFYVVGRDLGLFKLLNNIL